MKKFALFVCALMSTVFVYAQGLGDYMEIDGVPGFVFYLDDSGEHGLVMSFPQIDGKRAQKLVKKGKMVAEKTQRLIHVEKKIKVKSKDMKIYRNDLVNLLGDDGKQNQVIIADYCKEKNLDLSIFKGQDFAAHLGDGWFIPGDKELTLFAEYYAGGLGKDHTFSLGNSRAKEVSNDPLIQDVLWGIVFGGLRSSSLKDASWGFRAMVRIMPGALSLKVKQHFEIVDKVKVTKFSSGAVEGVKGVNGGVINTCAVYEF